MAVTDRDIDILRDSIEHMCDDDDLVFYSDGKQITFQRMSEIIDRISVVSEDD